MTLSRRTWISIIAIWVIVIVYVLFNGSDPPKLHYYKYCKSDVNGLIECGRTLTPPDQQVDTFSPDDFGGK